MIRPNSRFLNYFYWLTFTGTLFTIGEMLRGINELRLVHRLPWTNIFVSYALVGMSVILASLCACVFLAVGERLIPLSVTTWHGVCQGSVFVLFFAVWLNLFRLLLASNGLQAKVLPPFQILGYILIGVVLFVRFRLSLSVWMDETARRLRPFVWITTIVCLCLSGYLVIERLVKSRTAQPSVSRSGEHPNIILIALDALTARDMSLYGYHLPTTPNLERLTRTWTVYEDANSTGNGTIALLPTIITGRYPYLDDWYRYGDLSSEDKGWLDLNAILKSNGFETAFMMYGLGPRPSTYHMHAGFQRVTIDTPKASDVLKLTLFTPMVLQLVLNDYIRIGFDSKIPADNSFWNEPLYAAAETYFREKAAAGQKYPFFAYLHFQRPHEPYIANEFLGRFLPIEDGMTDNSEMHRLAWLDHTAPQSMLDKMRLRYDENILKADEEVAHLVDLLRQSGLYDNSLLIITADHGSNFQAGYPPYYSHLLTAAEHSIPLLVKYPHQTEGRRVAGLVSTVDIFPTILDVLGVPHLVDYVDGQSLRRAGEDKNRTIFVRCIDCPATWAALRENWKLVSREGSLFLFNLSEDPKERKNLIGEMSVTDLQISAARFGLRMRFLRSGGNTLQAPSLTPRVLRH